MIVWAVNYCPVNAIHAHSFKPAMGTMAITGDGTWIYHIAWR